MPLSSREGFPATDQHIVNAVNHLFPYAFDQKTSDIHIEPKRQVCLVRMRIDRVLHTVYKLPKQLYNTVISRIKPCPAWIWWKKTSRDAVSRPFAKGRRAGIDPVVRENGIQKMLAGETTYQEVLRITWDRF